MNFNCDRSRVTDRLVDKIIFSCETTRKRILSRVVLQLANKMFYILDNEKSAPFV